MVRFWITAEAAGAVRSFPPIAPATTCLYLSGSTTGIDSLPLYRILMAAADQNELETRDVDSNVLLPCTVIFEDEVRYLAGIRYRGHSARDRTDKSYRVDFTPGRPLWDVRKLNLNAYHSYLQVLGADMCRRANVPAPLERFARMSLSGGPAGLYSQVERVDGDFLSRQFPDDDNGDLFRGDRQADLGYRGSDLDYYRLNYLKQNNEEIEDYSAIMALTRVFSTSDEDEFERELPSHIDVDEWLRWFAVEAVLNDDEGKLSNVSGDDYYIYQRPSDGRFVLIAWDMDSTLADPYGSVYRPSLASVRRLLRSPAFSARYLAHVVDIARTAGAPLEMESRVQRYDSWIPTSVKTGLSTYPLERNSSIHGQLRRHLSVFTPERDRLRETLIAEGDTWRFFRGVSEPSNGSTAWTGPGFNDSAWEEGPSGFGYGDGDDRTYLEDMPDAYVSVYIRSKFVVHDKGGISSLLLSIDYDDGFVAYLNGVEVARAHVSGTPPPFGQRASDHEAGTPEVFDLSSRLALLVEGDNVLAVQGHNQSSGSSDFSLIPELITVRDAAGSVALTGFAPVLSARAVLVNGATADYDPARGTWRFQDETAAPGYLILARDEAGALVGSVSLTLPPDKAPTLISSNIAASTTWIAETGPYSIAGAPQVVAGATLTIGPGVEIRMQPGASLHVRGGLLALGTAARPVRFVDAGGGDPWGSIMLDQTTGANVFSHVVFSRGDGATAGTRTFPGAIGGYRCALTVRDCTFQDNEQEAIDTIGCPLIVEDSLLRGNLGGIHCNQAPATLVGNVILDTIGDHDSIDFNQYLPGGFVITDNVLINGGDDGMDSENAAGTIERNIVVGYVDSGLSLERGGPYRISNNLVYDCGDGINLKDGLFAELVYNTIVDNRRAGLRLEPKSSEWGAEAAIRNGVIWNNAPSAVLVATSSISLAYSLVEDGTTGPGVLDMDPRFISRALRDYRPAADSPLLGAAGASDIVVDLLGELRELAAGNTIGAYQQPVGILTPTPTFTPTPTATATSTSTWTPTSTPTATSTYTWTFTATPSMTPTPTVTATATPTPTLGLPDDWADLDHDGDVDEADLVMLIDKVDTGEMEPSMLLRFAGEWGRVFQSQ